MRSRSSPPPPACATPCGAARCATRPTTCSTCSPTRERCQVVLVTLPEATPVNELIETAYAVEERVGVRLGPVVVNQVDVTPTAPGSGRRALRACAAPRWTTPSLPRDFRRERVAAQQAELSRLADHVALPRIVLPKVAAAGLTAEHVAALALGIGVSVEAARSMAVGARGARVVVCCGSGGVGKTTMAAVTALEARRAGRRAVVVTIDPARRLADALGLPDGLRGEPQRIERADLARRAVGDDARHARDVRPRGARPRHRRRPGAPHRREPLLPQHRRCPQRHAGVHGVRGALRAARRRALRPRRGRHPTEPQRARLPRRARRARRASSTIPCSSC